MKDFEIKIHRVKANSVKQSWMSLKRFPWLVTVWPNKYYDMLSEMERGPGPHKGGTEIVCQI